MEESSSNVWKTLWEKEKLLVTSNFSFSHSVFKSLVMQTRKNQGLFGKGLKSYILSYLTTFLMMRKKASFADMQKFLPYIAVWK